MAVKARKKTTKKPARKKAKKKTAKKKVSKKTAKKKAGKKTKKKVGKTTVPLTLEQEIEAIRGRYAGANKKVLTYEEDSVVLSPTRFGALNCLLGNGLRKGGIVEIKPRGLKLDTDALQKRLRGKGERALSILWCKIGSREQAFIAERRVVI